MFRSQRKCLFVRNNSNVRILTVWSFLLISVLSQGCSTENQSQQASMGKSLSNEQIESIGAPQLVVEKASYDFGEIAPGSRNTAVFNFTNAGDKPLEVTNVKRCCGAVINLDKEIN